MADPQDDADKIRLKRLERLQALERSQSASAGPSSSSSAGASASSSAPSAPTRAAAASASASESAATKPSSSKPGTRTPAAANGGGSSSTAAGASASAPSVGPVRTTPKAAPTSGTSTPVSRPSTSTPSTSSRPAASAATPSQQTQQALQIPYPQWFSSTASRIFQFTLSQSRAETSNWSIVFLYTLHQELQDEVQQDGESNAAASTSEAGMRFDEENLERAIVARLSMDAEQMSEADEDPVAVTVLASLPPRLTNLEHLVQCWKRWGPERARLGPISVKPAADSELAKRIEALDFIKRKIIEGIGLQLQEPSLFPQPSDKTLGGPELLPSLLQLPNLESSPLLVLESHQALALLSDIASVYSTPASSADLVDVLGVPLLQPIIDKLGAKESSIQAMLRAVQGANPSRDGILDLAGLEWRNVVRTVNDIAEIKALANMFVEMPNWIPAGAPAQTIELESLLGPLLRLGCFTDSAPSVAKAYFAQPSALSKEAIEASSNALRNTLSSLQGLLFNIFNLVVRSSPASREGVLSHFAQIVKLNHRRDGMRVDRRTVSSDGFMINNFSVLMDFATPFMDASYSRIDKIDVEYFRKCKGRLDISEMTKIHATSEEAKEYYAVGAEVAGSPNFISEIFFLSTAFMHYGLAPALTMHEHLYRQLRHMQDDLKEAEQNRQYDGTPQEAAYRQQLERHKAEVEAYHARIIASEVQLCDPGFIARAANFSSFVMTWLVRQVDPRGQHPMKEVELESLPAKTPLAFSMLPEYIVEDVTEFYFFISRYAPQTMIDMQKDQLLVFIVVFLCTPYINNPYLKGKFVEILYRNTRSWGPRYPRGTLGDTLNYHPLALKGLLPALMTVYCQIEFTGQHNQFYEKFEVRHQISKILRLIWETREHREAFKAETGKEDFVRFVNFLLNDTTFLMDEALGRLKQIHDLQQEMADKATWDAQTDEQKKDKEKLLKSAEGQAHSNLVYGYESLFLFKTLTAEAPIPFLRGEIVDRLTSSLDYNLNILAGPQCQELRVQDKEKYRFKPRELLADIMQIIINLANNDAYVVSTAKDGRSYSKALFDNAIRIASRAGIKTEQQLQILRRMVTKIEELKVAEAEEDEMGEAPDEFLDPLTAEVMDDPVLLPSSQTIVDFNTIKQALLTVQQDPFNRSPLKLEDIVRDDRLRGEIQAWRDKRRADRLAKIEQAQPELKEAPAEPSGGDTTMEG